MSLHPEAIGPALWTLLVRLMRAAPLKDFCLVGGTALALRYGHRVSVDIDLFTDQAFDAPKLGEYLSQTFELTQTSIEENTVMGAIHGIKVDCIAHRYPMVVGIEEIGPVRLLAVEDIAAMKLNAIANRGNKKDFWDLYELMHHFERRQLLSFYKKKYPQSNLWAVEKSMSWFEDAGRQPDPPCLKGRTWNQIQSDIADWNRL